MSPGKNPDIKKLLFSNPVLQCLIVLVISWIILIFTHNSGTGHFSWNIIASAILLYAGANPVTGIFNKKWGRYLLFSIIGYGFLIFGLVWLYNQIAMVKFDEERPIRMLIIIVSVFFILINMLVAFYRYIIKFLNEN